MLDQLYPAVLGLAFRSVVRCNGGILATAVGFHPRGPDAVLDERLHDGLRPVLGKLEVVLGASRVVGVADDVDLEARIVLEELGYLADRLRRFGLNRRAVGVEGDPVNGCVAGRPDVVLEYLGARLDVLGHPALLDDPEPDLPVALHRFDPRLLTVLDYLGGDEPGGFAEEYLSADFFHRVLVIADNFEGARFVLSRSRENVGYESEFSLDPGLGGLAEVELVKPEVLHLARLYPVIGHSRREKLVVLASLEIALLGCGGDGRKYDDRDKSKQYGSFHPSLPICPVL